MRGRRLREWWNGIFGIQRFRLSHSVPDLHPDRPSLALPWRLDAHPRFSSDQLLGPHGRSHGSELWRQLRFLRWGGGHIVRIVLLRLFAVKL